MRLFGRRKPLHEQLAEDGGLAFGVEGTTAGLVAQPPDWNGDQRGEPGIHGVPRPRRWDAVVTADAPDIPGEAVHFVALPDSTLVVDEDVPDGALGPLANAVETRLPAPYRAEGVRRGGRWAVAARRIEVVRDRSLTGDVMELVVANGERSLTVDGEVRVPRAPSLQRAGEAEGSDYVVRATRLDDELWEVEAAPL